MLTVAVFIEPLVVLLGLLKVELASVDNLLEVNVRLYGLNDLRIRVELKKSVLNFLLLFFRHQVSLVEQDDVGELDLINHELY